MKTLILSFRKVKVFQLIIINFSFLCGFYCHCLIRAEPKLLANICAKISMEPLIAGKELFENSHEKFF